MALRPFDRADFSSFFTRIIPTYAAAKVTAGEWTLAASLESARAEVDARLPRGLQTPGHELLAVRDAIGGQRVGDLWLEFRTEAGRSICAVLDLHILPQRRRAELPAATTRAKIGCQLSA